MSGQVLDIEALMGSLSLIPHWNYKVFRVYVDAPDVFRAPADLVSHMDGHVYLAMDCRKVSWHVNSDLQCTDTLVTKTRQHDADRLAKSRPE
jgi:hypothetical protein